MIIIIMINIWNITIIITILDPYIIMIFSTLKCLDYHWVQSQAQGLPPRQPRPQAGAAQSQQVGWGYGDMGWLPKF